VRYRASMASRLVWTKNLLESTTSQDRIWSCNHLNVAVTQRCSSPRGPEERNGG
jgi:hypothetical protein